MSCPLTASDETLAWWHRHTETAQELCGRRNRNKARQLEELESIFDELQWRRKRRPIDDVADDLLNYQNIYKDGRFLANRENGERQQRGAVEMARKIAVQFVKGERPENKEK